VNERNVLIVDFSLNVVTYSGATDIVFRLRHAIVTITVLFVV